MKVEKIAEGVIQQQLTNEEEKYIAGKYGLLEFNREMILKIIDVWLEKPGTKKTLVED